MPGGLCCSTHREFGEAVRPNDHTQLFLYFTRPSMSPANEEDFAEIRKRWVGIMGYVIPPLLLQAAVLFVAIGQGHLHLTSCMACKLFGTANPGPSHDLCKRGVTPRCQILLRQDRGYSGRSASPCVRQETSAGHGKISLRPAHSPTSAVCKTGFASTWRSPTRSLPLRAL